MPDRTTQYVVFLGIANVSTLVNLLHLASGLAGMALSRSVDGARSFLIGGDVAYLLLFGCGVIVDRENLATLAPVNTAGHWLHLGLGIIMTAIGVVLSGNKKTRSVAGTAREPPDDVAQRTASNSKQSVCSS